MRRNIKYFITILTTLLFSKLSIALWAMDLKLSKDKAMSIESVLEESLKNHQIIFMGGCFQDSNDFIFLNDHIELLKNYGVSSIALEFPFEDESGLKNYLEDQNHSLSHLRSTFRPIFRSNGGKFGEFLIKAHKLGINIFLIDKSEVMPSLEKDIIDRKDYMVNMILRKGGFLECPVLSCATVQCPHLPFNSFYDELCSQCPVISEFQKEHLNSHAKVLVLGSIRLGDREPPKRNYFVRKAGLESTLSVPYELFLMDYRVSVIRIESENNYDYIFGQGGGFGDYLKLREAILKAYFAYFEDNSNLKKESNNKLFETEKMFAYSSQDIDKRLIVASQHEDISVVLNNLNTKGIKYTDVADFVIFMKNHEEATGIQGLFDSFMKNVGFK